MTIADLPAVDGTAPAERPVRPATPDVDPRRDRGASAVEYGLLVAAIAALVVGVVFGLGNTIKGQFTQTSSCIATSGSATGC
jgi:pilus assembly protein Flp/PilA